MTHFKTFPFTAIVGQDLMKMALILNAINPKIGGVLIQGTKGTAKSTAVRALADLLPEIKVVKECPFNCNPDNLKESCHACQHKILDHEFTNEQLEYRKMRVINLPINATEDRVVGTIDIKTALTQGLKALEPGILAEANRNILYIDEVNLLSDNVADVLLDSAAMGINIIEREGISLHHPANFILIGTMNPEEGNLRPQLLDRFGLSVQAYPIHDIEKRIEIMKSTEEYQKDPHVFYEKYSDKQAELRNKIINARKILDDISIKDELLRKIAEISANLKIDSHRADISMNRTAKTIAAFNGRNEVNLDDIKIAAKLALSHRIRKLPFEEMKLDEEKIDEIINNNQENNQDHDEADFLEDSIINPPKEEVFEINTNINAQNLLNDKKVRKIMDISGKRIKHPTSSNKGKYIGGKKPRSFNFTSSDIAINETLNHAALESINGDVANNGNLLVINENNLHIKKRIGKSSYLIIFCVDASGSMGVQERMKSVKGAVFSILQTNYIYRDKVSLIAFRKDKAEIILPPTRSTDLAYKLLKEIPTGGTTPLVSGLMKAHELAKEEIRKNSGYIPLIILLTDARGNVFYNDAIEDLMQIGHSIVRDDVQMIIIDTEPIELRIGLCKKLAEEIKVPYYHLDHLTESNLNQVLNLQGIIDSF